MYGTSIWWSYQNLWSRIATTYLDSLDRLATRPDFLLVRLFNPKNCRTRLSLFSHGLVKNRLSYKPYKYEHNRYCLLQTYGTKESENISLESWKRHPRMYTIYKPEIKSLAPLSQRPVSKGTHNNFISFFTSKSCFKVLKSKCTLSTPSPLRGRDARAHIKGLYTTSPSEARTFESIMVIALYRLRNRIHFCAHVWRC